MTTANTTAQLATFLNVSPNQIKSVTELHWVYCVVVRGCKARFVSKKVVTTEKKMDSSNLYKIHCLNGDVVVVNAKREKLSEGYIVRKGYDCANIVIRINPMSKDVRSLRVDTIGKNNLGRVEAYSAEYDAVCKIAFAISAPELVATVSAWDTAPFPEAYARAEACSYAV